MDPLSVQQQQFLSSEGFNFTTELSRMGEGVAGEGSATTSFITPVLITFVALGFIGNLILLYAVCAVGRFNRAENLMLANLSAASIFITFSTLSVYTQLTNTMDFDGPFYCKLYPGIHSCMLPAEGLTMMCISLERTQRVRFPLMRATKVSAIKKIAVIWSLALLLELPRGFLFYEYDPDMESFIKCRNTKQILGSWIPYVMYVITTYSVNFLSPSLLLFLDWIRLASQLQFLIACQTMPLPNEYRKTQKKLIRHAMIFTSIFIAVKVPVGTHYLLYQLPPQLLSGTVIEWVKTWKHFFFSVGTLHCSFYPFIIFALSRDMREYLFCCENDHRHPPLSRF